MPDREPKEPEGVVQTWIAYLKRKAKTEYIQKLPEDHLVRLAGLLSLVGSPREETDAFWAFSALFLNRKRLTRWNLALDEIPPTPTAMHRITACVQAYNKIIGEDGRGRNIATAHCKLDSVVKAMLMLSSPEKYVEQKAREGAAAVELIFHENTVANATNTLKGVMGPLSDDNYRKSLDDVEELEF